MPETAPAAAPKDLQAHIALLEEKGLLIRVDRPINKDTELHPLARWQFQGGLPEDERRAFLFTNVVDSKGRGIVNAYNVPAVCGGVRVNPGDLVFADYDGVIVIPPEVLPDVIRLAKEKAASENHSRPELMQGAYLRDVYRKYGVL